MVHRPAIVGLMTALFVTVGPALGGSAHPALPRAVIEVFPGPNAIANALDIADPGDVLNIHGGVYPEHVTVAVDRVTLQGAGDGTATIDATCSRGNTIVVRAESVTLRGLRVVGAAAGGIAVDFSFVDRGRITNSLIRDTCGDAEYGINVFGGGSIAVVANSTAGFDDAGIYIGGITSTPFGPLAVRNNESFGNTRGVIVEDSVGGTILVGENRVDGNDTTGIWLNNTRGVRVGRNTVTDSGTSGIETDPQSTGNLIRSNTVSGNPVDLVNGGNPNCWIDNIYDTSQGDVTC